MNTCSATVMAAILQSSLMIGGIEAATIFYDNFDGSALADLHGSTPDTTSGGAAWVASSDFKANGVVNATASGSATLAFTPVHGKTYTLDCSLSNVTGGSSWFALGFTAGQNTSKDGYSRFIEKNVIGKAWLFIRGTASGKDNNQAFLGSDTKGPQSGTSWVTYTTLSGGDVLMRIVLDTTGGPGNWSATWYARKPDDASYMIVRSTANMLTESINAVGFAISGTGISGTIESFSLSVSDKSIDWDVETTSSITTNSAFASATVHTNLTETLLLWDTLDQGIDSTNAWSFRRSLGSNELGVVGGQITNLTADTRYTWRFYGENDSNQGWSAPNSFATTLGDAQAPVFIDATALSPNIIALNWQDNASTETGYVLQRSTLAEGGYATVAVLGTDVNSYTDNVDLAESTVYYYQLAATNKTNNSGTDLGRCQTNVMTTAWSGRWALRGPYRAGANTLHLWHMDEADASPVQPALGVNGSFSLIPTNGATMGAAAYNDFGTAGDTSAALSSGFRSSAILPVSSVVGADGAFTFEALIRIASVSQRQQIITMDNNGGTAGERPFQFRLDADTAEGAPATGALRFINISGAQDIVAPLPTIGDHGFVPNQWFHVAVTYNGSEDTPDNMKFYWTRVDARPFQANQIFSAVLTNDLAGSSAILGVGNEYRYTSDNNIVGQIDEVRISNIARAPDQMMFYKIPGTTMLVQ